jgi:SecD/SecF fusion protein
LSNNPLDTTFLKALNTADKKNISGVKYLEDFVESFENIDDFETKPTLAGFFITPTNQDRITFDSNSEEVLKYLTQEFNSAVESVSKVVADRLANAKFEYSEVQKDSIETGVLIIRIPAIKDPQKVEKLICSSGKLEFWETYDSEEIVNLLIESDKYLADFYNSDNSQNHTSLLEKLNPQIESYSLEGSIVGYTKMSDKESVMADLQLLKKNKKLPRDLVFAWSVKESKDYPGYYGLYALKSYRDAAVLSGNFLIDAKSTVGQNQVSPELLLVMNEEATELWSRITRENVSKAIAIVFDGYVYSAPIVNDEIKGGKSSITGNFSVDEANELANILKSGSMPYVKILSIEVIEPKK